MKVDTQGFSKDQTMEKEKASTYGVTKRSIQSNTQLSFYINNICAICKTNLKFSRRTFQNLWAWPPQQRGKFTLSNSQSGIDQII